MALPIDWNAIRPLDGSSAKGFEELCAQLARAESPPGSRFERKGTPDAGVECYTVLDDDNEWGWQAKYIHGLGEAQWPQLDDSIQTALEKHPRLVRYFICTPLDRPDARIEGRRSAMQRWDEHVEKWLGWATARGMVIEFVWWGSHELLDRLAHSQHVGRVRFWFDIHGFDGAWFQARLEEAVRTAGPRYTPEIHVALPIAAELDAFGRTEQFFDHVKAHAKSIRKSYQTFGYSESKVGALSLIETAATVSTKVQAVLSGLGSVAPQPTGRLPFRDIADQAATAEVAAAELGDLLTGLEREHDAKSAEAKDSKVHFSHRDNPFRESRHRLYSLQSELRATCEGLEHAEDVAGGSLMLLKGAAGTGKTHLLCDVAKQRLAAGRPTVLLMGQQFIAASHPWPQAIRQLDLPDISVEHFVGALEAAAQAAGCRALFMIDGINEGLGRLIWPDHLAAFLAHFERSPWIGVLLSVRTSYEEIVVPEDVRARAVGATHRGFAEHEYDATRTFFVHYGLELPTTPLLAPEFRNPLFLKTLCRGLSATGERRLPRGFHGITATFDLYLNAINQRLASVLDFNPRHALVRQALEAFTGSLVLSDERWLTLSKAEEVVNALLPGREFERSLYRGLVAEGVLVEEATLVRDSSREEIVFIAYERFADHLIAKKLLDSHLANETRSGTLAMGGPLAFLRDERRYIPAGLLEALCIQFPERTGQELVQFVPELMERWGTGDAFRQSLVWRSSEAFSESTRDVLKSLIRSDQEWNDTHDVILTIAMLPGHPLNARLLDHKLRAHSMPDRDAWWSTYLHESWGNRGAVDRLVDWASSVSPDITLDDETIDLCAITLTWMLATSNRFLRDRVTKSLVNLLTGRFGPAVRLVEQFANVDDLYVAERVYAVAYGVATRSNDPEAVGVLAQCVYNHVFAASTPPAHALLRDYARGVVERALFLGARIGIAVESIRPPYQSTWPHIPTEEEIKLFMADWSRGAHDSGELEWARNRISSSVMNDDFGRYVIGTNSSSTSNTWLSITLDDAVWQSADERLAALVSGFSDAAKAAWTTFDDANREMMSASFHLTLPSWLVKKLNDTSLATTDGVSDTEELVGSIEEIDSPAVADLKISCGIARGALIALLSHDQIECLNNLLEAKETGPRQPPGFELQLIQRYIIWRVFDLGWTIERFGKFDRFSVGSHGRDASKAERIGKKYQWIAYHEIMAYISDHYQYREAYRESGDRSYDGPWQDSLRDIDPTCTLPATRGGTSWDGHTPAWWGSARYEDWGDPDDPRGWAMRQDNLPKLDELLRCTRNDDMSRWFNLQGYFNWRQQPPADQEAADVERRDLWCACTGYLIRLQDAAAFMDWAKRVDLAGLRMPSPPEVYQMFMGEHCWSPAANYFEQPYYGDDGWTQPDHGCPAKIRVMSMGYSSAISGFDCSVDDSFQLRLPSSDVMSGLGLRWSGHDADFMDADGRLAAFDPTAHSDGPSALLIREDLLTEFLARDGFTVIWIITGEKRIFGPGFNSAHHESLQLSGAYMLQDGVLDGFLAYKGDCAR
jgi:hypothetical protein